MSQPWRYRETLQEPLTAALIERREAEGWRAAYVEWVREGAPAEPEPVEAPYGLQMEPASARLRENVAEFTVMLVILEGLVKDASLSQIALRLTEQGHTTRSGFGWTPAEVFDLLPRVIEYSPRLFNSEEWKERRSRLQAAVVSR